MANQTNTNPKLARLRRQLKAQGITQLAVAEASGAKPPHVCNVLAGRDISSKVILAAEKLLADRRSLRLGSASGPRPQTAREAPESPAPARSRDARGSRQRRANAAQGA